MKNFFKYLIVILGSALFFFSSVDKDSEPETPRKTGSGYQLQEKTLFVKTKSINAK